MAATTELKIVLTGALAGKKAILGGFRFREGSTTLLGDYNHVMNLARWFAKSFNAYPEGSAELAFKQAQDKRGYHPDGSYITEEDQRRGGHADLQSNESEPAPTDEDDDECEQSTDSPSWEQGGVPERDGHEDSGISVQPGSDRPDAIRKALSMLDPENEEHWNAQGSFRVDAVQEFFGTANVTRTAIQQAAPNFSRENRKLD